MEAIRSRQNAQLKRVRAVAAGKEPGMLALEGDRLVDEAVEIGMELEVCLVAEGREARANELAEKLGAGRVRLVEEELLQQASSLKTSPGVLAIAPAPRELDLRSLSVADSPLVAIACGISDPGNLGALARTAEAAGVGALALVGGASPWSTKALRGSMGSLLRLPIVSCLESDAEAVQSALTSGGWRQFRAATRDGDAFDAIDWTPPVALWITSETGELPPSVMTAEPVTIPMGGNVESLNVTVAAALLLFAASRGGRA